MSISLIGLISFPLTRRLFKNLPDNGYSLSRTFGVLLTSYLFWLFCSLGVSYNTQSGILFVLLIIIAASFTIILKSKDDKSFEWIRENFTYVIVVELLFLCSFLLFAWFRSNNPNILGTEKPMEYMFINSILQSPEFPPHDAWLSNHAISYYHFGYIMIAALARLTDIPSSIAYNLGLTSVFAMSFFGSFGLLVNLIDSSKCHFQDKKGKVLNSSILPSLLAPVLILCIGNLYGVFDILHNNGYLFDSKIPVLMYDYGKLSEENSNENNQSFSNSPGIVFRQVNVWEWLDLKRLPPENSSQKDVIDWRVNNWFFGSRTLHDRNLVGSEIEVIDEFPAFSFLLGDIHPHVLSLPFVLLAMGFTFSFFRELQDGQIPIFTSAKDIKTNIRKFIMIGLIFGALSFLNFWDLPIYLFILVVVYLSSLIMRGLSVRSIIQSTAIFSTLSIFSSVLLYLPFYLSFQSQAGGILPNLIYPTRTNQFLVHMGPLLIPVALFLVWLAYKSKIKLVRVLIVGFSLISFLALITLLFGIAAYFTMDPGIINAQLGSLSISDAISLALQKRLVSIFTPLLLATLFGFAFILLARETRQANQKRNNSTRIDWLLDYENLSDTTNPLDKRSSAPKLFILILVITSSLLLIGPDFLYLRDNFGTRMNTVFKFYFQAWIQCGIIATFGIWYLSNRAGLFIRNSLKAYTLVIILLGLLYTIPSAAIIMGSYSGEQSLDGMRYFSLYYPDDWKAIQWLNDNAKSNDVILEGTRGAYWVEGISSRISMATGLQTIMGWANHESQWRGSYFSSVVGRLDDIRLVYQSQNWEETDRILELYDVKYVVISPLEEQWYGPISVNKFERNMQIVFESGNTIIYQKMK